MNRFINLVVISALIFTTIFAYPINANAAPKNNVSEFTFTVDDVIYTASIIEHGKGSITTTVTGSDGSHEVSKATRNKDIVTIETEGKTTLIDVSIKEIDSMFVPEVALMSNYIHKGIINYNPPIGHGDIARIDYLYRIVDRSEVNVDLHAILGLTVSAAITVIAFVRTPQLAPMYWQALVTGSVFISSGIVVYVIANSVTAIRNVYEVKGRRNGVIGSSSYAGDKYFIRNAYGVTTGEHNLGFVPEYWTDETIAFLLFKDFFAQALYNGVRSHTWLLFD
ncbi:hypothetical protein BHU72_14455 [Desulfuribacillus stibiiarsenatis]|uniref:Bacterial Ig domain-containing protein n=1 Tax=Desulfuribacillus stibiiarsenatis TaxID=1390249 RepID=A0A1E5L7J5_9FIRM|nr:hypothetical protein [Desulfuribacillus stibiiarsenatis]OEH86120.1 hypothetical protein BHU72_14455 [Desulfuribacillus stibiiarsenatis]